MGFMFNPLILDFLLSAVSFFFFFHHFLVALGCHFLEFYQLLDLF